MKVTLAASGASSTTSSLPKAQKVGKLDSKLAPFNVNEIIPTEPITTTSSRPHETFTFECPLMRYEFQSIIGKGAFGKVFKVSESWQLIFLQRNSGSFTGIILFNRQLIELLMNQLPLSKCWRTTT